MEIMYANKTNAYFKRGIITGFYKDKLDLVDYLNEFYGISYDDEWTVKRFLNGLKFKMNENILKYLKEFNLPESILNKKIKVLSSNEFKFIFFIELLLEDPEVFIFDYFDIGLSAKNKIKFINYIRELKNKDKTIIVISNNLGFLYEISDKIMIIENKKLIFNGTKRDLFGVKRVKEEPPIISFIRKANKKGANLLYTTDAKELLKDIYRSLK